MRVGPARARGQKQQHAASRARLSVQCLEERATDASPTVGLSYDEGADLRRRSVVLDCGSDLEMGHAYDLVVDLGDHDPVADDCETFEAGSDRVGLGWIAQLS